MTGWVVLFVFSLLIRRGCVKRLKAQRVSRNQSAYTQARQEQDRPYAECFDEVEDDL